MPNAPLPDEALLPLRQALGRRLGDPTRSTLVRWAVHGLRTPDGAVVRLPTWQIGTRWMTTRRLADEFATKVITATGPGVTGAPVPGARVV